MKTSSGSSVHKKGCYQPFKKPRNSLPKKAAGLTGKHESISHGQSEKGRGKSSNYTSQPAKGQWSINGKYCVAPVYVIRLTGNQETSEQCQTLNVNSLAVFAVVADHVHFVVGHQ